MDEPLAQPDVAAQNQAALQSLSRMIALCQGTFSITLLRCNYLSLRSLSAQQLRDMCDFPIRELFLPPDVKSLYNFIEKEIATSETPALMVFGLESVQGIEKVLTSMNAERELFRNNFHFPLLLWVTDEILRTLIRTAPDFYSWASTCQLLLGTSELIDFIRESNERVFSAVLQAFTETFRPNSTILGPLGYSELESARRDLLALGVQLAPELEAGLQFIRGRDDYINDRIDAAIENYRQSLAFWQQGKDDNKQISHSRLSTPNNTFLERQGIVLCRIGLCYSRKAELQPAQSQKHWQQARDCLLQGVEAFKQAGREDLVAKFKTELMEVLRHLKAWEDLQELAAEALRLHQVYNQQVQLSQDYGFLAEVALEQCNWTVAKHRAKQALAILALAARQKQANASTLSQHQGLYLLLLARAQQKLGQYSQAIRQLEAARKESDPQYAPRLYLEILEELRKLYFQQHRYLEAFELKQEQRALAAQYGLSAFIGAGCLQPQLQVRNPAVESIAPSVTLPPEITVSRRQQDVNNLLNRISSTQHKLTVIHGQSGVGKSSIVRAGLVPALKQTVTIARDVLPVVLSGYTDWVVHLGQLLAEGLQEMRSLYLSAPLDSTTAIVEQLRLNGERNLLTVLIFDQFEEFFFLAKNQATKQVFFEFLRDCLDVPFVKVILSMRSDFLHYLLEGIRLTNLDAINNDILSKTILYYLGNLSPEDAKAVIQSLTERSQFYLEPELTERLVQDLASEMGEVRPIELQVVGSQLQTNNIRTLEQYEKHGPKTKLVEQFLEEVVKDCGPENERSARLILYFLTDKNDPRPLRTKDELAAKLSELEPGQKIDLDLVLKILVKSGLVFLVGEFPTPFYQLVHDYLAAFIRQQNEPDLSEIENLRKREKMSKAEIEQLRKEKEMVDQLKETKARLNLLLRVTITGAAIAALVLVSLIWLAIAQTQEAISQRKEAEKARTDALKAASSALVISNENDQLGILLTSVKIGIESQNAKARLEDKNQIAERLRQAVSRVQEINRFQGHNKSVLSVSFSPGEEAIASAGDDNTIKLWRVDGYLLKTLTGHKDAVTNICFSSDGKLLASASADRTIKLWNVEDGRELQTFRGHSETVTSVSFSPDGRILASASADKTIKLWNTSNGKLIKTINAHNKWVLSVSFSPDARYLASASEDKTVKLWKSDGQPLKTLLGHNDIVYNVSFSPDGKTLASASADTTVKLWNLDDGKELKTFKGHSDEVLGVSFSRDGKMLASASADTTVKLWSVEGTLLNTLKGHQDDVMGVSFSSDGKKIASASVDKTVRLWRIDSTPLRQTLTGHSDWVYRASFSPDGDLIASASYDKTVRLWLLDSTALRPLEGHKDWVSWVSFSPDGQTIASASYDKTVILWSRDGTLLNTIKGHSGAIFSVSFNSEGDKLITASQDKTAKIWRRSDGALLASLQHEDNVTSAIFSPDGEAIATSSDDSTVKLWRKDGTLLKTLRHGDKVTSVSFSPDAQMLASSSADKTVKLWRKDGRLVEILYHKDRVNSVSFSPKGDLIASASEDKTVTLWRKDGTRIATLDNTEIVNSLSFSPDGKILALATKDKTVILWRVNNLNLENLIASGCDWLQDYLKNNPYVLEEDRRLCEGIYSSL
ncbi:MAG: hypothetical protein N3E45_10855 [Oscillatoriaceae bacterium SKW80]|nr:hypothetical protein [Oscillatoriaceae bacterium SKYG93]MCX8121311.1 hypothetical protein [Oscillatoriaceae bacterium SKW80]MDW8453355.1 hypothetical protein [Oscillatoriaceae cyanobacterium SKYGB_i_bin93]HIK26709.1 hypothetical protein [Oscillatoriaceae cyanobacterium M7585_C2015_266]